MKNILIFSITIIIALIAVILIFKNPLKINSDNSTIIKATPMIEKSLSGKKVAMVIAFEDFKDEEYFVPKEILEKAGVDVKTASNKEGQATGVNGGRVQVDILVENLNPADFEAVIFIGGPGALTDLDNENSYQVIKETVSQNKILASICVSPAILAKAGVLQGKKATVWSSALDQSFVKTLEENGAVYQDKPVAQDRKTITANGPETAQEFGQAIVATLAQ